jgi:hypothetical protein
MAFKSSLPGLLPLGSLRDAAKIRSNLSMSWGERNLTLMRIAILSSAVLLMLPGAWGHSVTVVEFAQLPAGLAAWQRQSLGIYRVCGPVSKFLYALPVHLAGISIAYPDGFDSDVRSRREWQLGQFFQSQYRQQYHDVYRWSRLLPVVVTVLSGALVCEWSTRLYGDRPGIVSLCLWSWMPPVLAHGSLVTSDMPSAFTLLLAARCFWSFLKRPSFPAATVAGVALGFAAATKFTLLMLYPCWIFLVTGRVIQTWLSPKTRAGDSCRSPLKLVAFALIMFTVSVITIDALYLFAGVGFRLAEWRFERSSIIRELLLLCGHRITAWILRVPMPFPVEFLRGLEFQLADTERLQSAYLMGKSRLGGWWYWYAFATLFKVPLPAMVLFGLALFRLPWVVRQCTANLWSTLCLILPALEGALTIAATTGTGTNAAFRYLLPSLASLCVWAGIAWNSAGKTKRWTLLFLLSWLVFDAIVALPDHLGWQNELGEVWRCATGRPALIGDSLDWGQDLARLSAWVTGHSSEGSTLLSIYGMGEAEPYGLSPPLARPVSNPGERFTYLAVSEEILLGPASTNYIRIAGEPSRLSQTQRDLLLQTNPFDRVGRTIRIYRLDSVLGGVMFRGFKSQSRNRTTLLGLNPSSLSSSFAYSEAVRDRPVERISRSRQTAAQQSGSKNSGRGEFSPLD